MRNKIITVFGSAFTKANEQYYSEVEAIGRALAKNGFDVCSGGYGGVMEAVSKGAKAAGGKTIGVTVSEWTERKANKYIDEEVAMPNLMERITELITLAHGYIILKGGTGTLVELSVALELMNKKSMSEKPVILYGSQWFNLIETLKQDSENLSALIDRNVKFANTNEDCVASLKTRLKV